MIVKRFVGKVWRWLPRKMQKFIARFPQTKFTASAGAVVFNAEGKVLLLEHLLRPADGWGIPGGFINQGEQGEQTVRREIKEECGLVIEKARLMSVRTVGSHIEQIFICTAQGEPRPMSREIFQAKWADVNNLPPKMSKIQSWYIEMALSEISPAEKSFIGERPMDE